MKHLIWFLFLEISYCSVYSQNKKDLQDVIQLCINIPELQNYYHPEIEGRVPLVIMDNGIVANDIELQQFGQSVLFINDAEFFFYGITSFLKFQKVNFSGRSSNVQFLYPIEGLEVKVNLRRHKNTWKLKSKEIVEQ